MRKVLQVPGEKGDKGGLDTRYTGYTRHKVLQVVKDYKVQLGRLGQRS